MVTSGKRAGGHMISHDKIEIINNVLLDKVEPYLIILFGSLAKGYARANSDIDIAYLSDMELDEYEIFMIAQELANRIGSDVDLVDLKKASTVFRAQVVGSGKVIYCNDEQRKSNFQIHALKDYALLNEERLVVLNNIKKRGRVYHA